jgi:hypothetical protein
MIKARLAESFPAEQIVPKDLPATIYYKAGQASVVSFINQIIEED